MTIPASYHEAGDPLFEALATEERRAHAGARSRGERLATLTDAIIDRLVARGLAGAHDDETRVAVFSVLADCLAGNAAIDIPRRRTVDES